MPTTNHPHTKTILELMKARFQDIRRDSPERLGIWFDEPDFIGSGILREECYVVLNQLKADGVISSIEVNDPNGSYQIDEQNYVSYKEQPNLFPGLYVLDLPSDFEQLWEAKYKEVTTPESPSPIAYQVTRDHRTREIKVNGVLLSRPNFDSENDNFADYIMNHQNKAITLIQYEAYAKEKLKKKFDRIVTDLGFKDDVKSLFFPNVSKKAIEFVNPITEAYLGQYNIPPLEKIPKLSFEPAL